MGDTRRIGSALGSWLMRKLKDAGFGNGVIVKSVERRMEAGSLKELGDNLMGVKDMFYKGCIVRMRLGACRELWGRRLGS